MVITPVLGPGGGKSLPVNVAWGSTMIDGYPLGFQIQPWPLSVLESVQRATDFTNFIFLQYAVFPGLSPC